MFFFRTIGFTTKAAVAAGLVGATLFGRDAISYVSSGVHSVQNCVSSNVPVEFQLQRARDLVAGITPEMQSNIRLIAQQEVEIEQLKTDIDLSGKNLAGERLCVAKLRDQLGTENASFTFGQFTFSRDQVKEDLAHRFDNLKQAEVTLAEKQKLLENRTRSLLAAEQALERIRGQKALLEGQIAALEAQNQLVNAAAVGSRFEIDHSKLAQSEQLIGEIKKQLDVTEKVLAHESNFTPEILVETVNEADLVKQVDSHLAGTGPMSGVTADATKIAH